MYTHTHTHTHTCLLDTVACGQSQQEAATALPPPPPPPPRALVLFCDSSVSVFHALRSQVAEIDSLSD